MKKITTTLMILVFLNQAYAFKLGIHEEITKAALKDYGFDEKTRQQAATANWLVDINLPNSSRAHADNNDLNGTSNRLVLKKDSVIRNLIACKRGVAVTELGQALHTVHDLYSHTNAVDNNRPLHLHFSMSQWR